MTEYLFLVYNFSSSLTCYFSSILDFHVFETYYSVSKPASCQISDTTLAKVRTDLTNNSIES